MIGSSTSSSSIPSDRANQQRLLAQQLGLPVNEVTLMSPSPNVTVTTPSIDSSLQSQLLIPGTHIPLSSVLPPCTKFNDTTGDIVVRKPESYPEFCDPNDKTMEDIAQFIVKIEDRAHCD